MERKIKDPSSVMDTYLQLVELTEPPLLYHRWAFISIVAATIGRNVWLPFGEQNIYPNHFITLIGPPGARKSTAIGIASDILRDSGYEYFAGDRSSKEKFLLDWEFGFDKIARGEEPTSPDHKDGTLAVDELLDTALDKDKVSLAYIKAGELEDFLGSGNAGFISTLTNLWDNPLKYTDRYKNSKSLFIPNPTVNLLGGATTTTFASIFSSNIIGQGMLSRLILVHGKGQRMRLTIPPPLPAQLRADIVGYLGTIRNEIKGPVTLTEAAYEAIDEIYNTFEELPDSRLASYSSRRLTHLLKLCIVIAASECTLEITLDTVILANTILGYTETYMPRALGEFGKSKNSETSQIVLDTIINAEVTGGITAQELFKSVGQDVESMQELANILTKLKNADKIKSADRIEAPGESVKVLVPIKRKAVSRSKFFDLDLLYEYRFKEAE